MQTKYQVLPKTLEFFCILKTSCSCSIFAEMFQCFGTIPKEETDPGNFVWFWEEEKALNTCWAMLNIFWKIFEQSWWRQLKSLEYLLGVLLHLLHSRAVGQHSRPEIFPSVLSVPIVIHPKNWENVKFVRTKKDYFRNNKEATKDALW